MRVFLICNYVILQFCIKLSLGFSLFCGCSKCSVGMLFCLFVKSMGDILLEQRISIKFLVRLEKNAPDVHKVLQTVYGEGEETVGRTW